MRKQYFPTTDQKVSGLNPDGVTEKNLKVLIVLAFKAFMLFQGMPEGMLKLLVTSNKKTR